MEDFLQARHLSPLHSKALQNRRNLSLAALGLNLLRAPLSWPQKLAAFHAILHDPPYRAALKEFALSQLAPRRRLFYTCARYRLPPLCLAFLYLYQQLKRHE